VKVAELKSVMSAEAKRVEAGSEQGALGKCRGELLMHLMKSNLCAAVSTNTWWHVVCCTHVVCGFVPRAFSAAALGARSTSHARHCA
jgi:hypothetical protein